MLSVPMVSSLGKTAVVTGVARRKGIGCCVVRKFLHHGYSVIGVDCIDEEESIDDKLKQSYLFVKADISKAADVAKVKDIIDSTPSKAIHVLINNAGIADPYMPTGSLEQTLDAWNKYISINLTGPFLMSQILLPVMADHSSIIHMSSTRARMSEPHSEDNQFIDCMAMQGYAASKAGLIGLTHAQAVSLQPRVRVNTILPGWIDTMEGPEGEITQEQRQWQLTGTSNWAQEVNLRPCTGQVYPLPESAFSGYVKAVWPGAAGGDVGQPDDVAELCLFLADGACSGYITGQEFVIDGGVTRKMYYP